MEEGKKDREECEGLGLGAPEAGLCMGQIAKWVGRLTLFFKKKSRAKKLRNAR
jgi:hypothetical protein